MGCVISVGSVCVCICGFSGVGVVVVEDGICVCVGCLGCVDELEGGMVVLVVELFPGFLWLVLMRRDLLLLLLFVLSRV